MNQRIYLVGYRGTGKSTVGPLVAAHLGWEFRDADGEFETRYGMTIRDCFRDFGEAGFREREAETLSEMGKIPNAVIATGGGITLRESNRQFLRETGFVVWLESDPATIWERISTDPLTASRRPNLAQGGIEEVRDLLIARETLYAEVAQLRISTDRSLPDEAADAILTAWNGTCSCSNSSC